MSRSISSLARSRVKAQRGQAIVEYAVTGVTIVLAFILGAAAVQPLLRANLEDSRNGMNYPLLRPDS